jgi:cardiolipin synthase (CMP-forming)
VTPVSLPVTRLAKVKTTVQVVAIAALIASSATERMLTGVTTAALAGMWIAAGLTFYTGYAYLQAGLSHAQADKRRPIQQSPGEVAPAVGREQRPA